MVRGWILCVWGFGTIVTIDATLKQTTGDPLSKAGFGSGQDIWRPFEP
jgi:hypothetical protein